MQRTCTLYRHADNVTHQCFFPELKVKPVFSCWALPSFSAGNCSDVDLLLALVSTLGWRIDELEWGLGVVTKLLRIVWIRRFNVLKPLSSKQKSSDFKCEWAHLPTCRRATLKISLWGLFQLLCSDWRRQNWSSGDEVVILHHPIWRESEWSMKRLWKDMKRSEKTSKRRKASSKLQTQHLRTCLAIAATLLQVFSWLFDVWICDVWSVNGGATQNPWWNGKTDGIRHKMAKFPTIFRGPLPMGQPVAATRGQPVGHPSLRWSIQRLERGYFDTSTYTSKKPCHNLFWRRADFWIDSKQAIACLENATCVQSH